MKMKIAKNAPYPIEVIKGQSYYWCSCGLSENQPFCDGSHQRTDMTPTEFVATESKTVYFCGCKQSASAPLCDGTHSDLQVLGNEGSLEVSMSFKHAKVVTVKTSNGQADMRDHDLIHLLNRHHCDINNKDFVIAWNQYCLHKYGYVLEIVDVGYEWSIE